MGVARRACALCAVCGIAWLAAGCRREPAPALQPVWVSRGALLPLHPAWNDVRALDVLHAHAARVAPPSAEPRLLARRVTLPRLLAPGPQARSSDFLPGPELIRTALDRLEIHRGTLRARSEQRVSELRRAAEAQVAVAVEGRRRELATDAANREEAIRTQAMRERRELEMRVIVLESRVRAMPGPARVAAEQELARVRADLKARDAALAERLAGVRGNLDQDLEQFRVAERARMDAALEEQTARDERDAEAVLAGFRQQLRAELDALAPAEGARLPGARSVPNVRLPAPGTGSEGITVQPARLAGRHASLDALRSHRARLVAVIRRDVEVQLARIAADKGWRLSPAAASGVPDRTTDAAGELRRRYAQEFNLPQNR